jgi:hypothetical protein
MNEVQLGINLVANVADRVARESMYDCKDGRVGRGVEAY